MVEPGLKEWKCLLICLFVAIIYSFSWGQSENKIQNLEKKLKSASGEERLEVLNTLCREYYKTSPQKTVTIGNQALSLARQLKNKKMEACILKNMGIGYSLLGNNEKAVEQFLNSLTIYEELGDKQGIANAINNVGIVFVELGKFQKALEYYLRSLEIREELGNKEDIADSMNNIALVYDRLKNYNKALEYHLKSSQIYKEIGKDRQIALSMNNIAVLYTNLGNYGQGLVYFLESLRMMEKIGNQGEMTTTLNNIGEVYITLRKYDKAYGYLARGLKMAKELGIKYREKDAYEGLSRLYSAQGKFKEAFTYYKRYSEMKDEIFTKENNDKIVEMQTRYEAERKEKENQILRKDKEIKETTIKKQKILTMALASILALVIILAFVRIKAKNVEYRLRTENELNQFFIKHDISQRESEIIKLLIKGKSNKEIEDVLFISSHTVKNHIYNIYKKICVKNRSELILLINPIKVNRPSGFFRRRLKRFFNQK
jgi:DNA-binding CsgD family transcriptional regulator/tetratricopeptide (TPR) repeat protein